MKEQGQKLVRTISVTKEDKDGKQVLNFQIIQSISSTIGKVYVEETKLECGGTKKTAWRGLQLFTSNCL